MDLTTLTADTLVEMADAPDDVSAELLRRLAAPEEDVFVLPVSVTEAIRTQFGSGRRTFDAISRRVRFAYKVWQGKYGPWNPEQADYAEQLVVFCIAKASTYGTPGHARAGVYTWLDRVVHHEDTHSGFKRREGELVNITHELGALV